MAQQRGSSAGGKRAYAAVKKALDGDSETASKILRREPWAIGELNRDRLSQKEFSIHAGLVALTYPNIARVSAGYWNYTVKPAIIRSLENATVDEMFLALVARAMAVPSYKNELLRAIVRPIVFWGDSSWLTLHSIAIGDQRAEFSERYWFVVSEILGRLTASRYKSPNGESGRRYRERIAVMKTSFVKPNGPLSTIRRDAVEAVLTVSGLPEKARTLLGNRLIRLGAVDTRTIRKFIQVTPKTDPSAAAAAGAKNARVIIESLITSYLREPADDVMNSLRRSSVAEVLPSLMLYYQTATGLRRERLMELILMYRKHRTAYEILVQYLDQAVRG